MAHLDGSGFAHLDRMLALVRRTRELLDRTVDEGRLTDEDAAFLESTTLPHVEGIQAGFTGWLRSDAADAVELRYLLELVAGMRVTAGQTEADRTAAAAEAAAEARFAAHGRADGARPVVRLSNAEPWHLAALQHARVVLAFIPRVPEDEVRYPAGRRTYVDIAVPRGPAELAHRIGELEAELWKTVTGRTSPPTAPSFRRVYGFFDAADRLGVRAFRGLS